MSKNGLASATEGYVGRSVAHDWSEGHVTGRTQFIADQPPLPGELWIEIVGSPVSHGKIVSVDIAAARAVPGIRVFTAADVPGANRFGPIVADECLLADGECHYLGEPVALVAAESREAARRAAAAIRVEIESLPPILTVEEALAAESFLTNERTLRRGDVDAALARAPRRLDETLRIGGQEHLYLETQCALAVPDEFGNLTLYGSTQNPTESQFLASRLLNKGMHQIVCVCRRMGGGFGGKESQGAIPTLMAALVAHHTGRPARIEYGRQTDLRITGKRHPYRVDYAVGFTDEGEITALDIAFWANGGATADLSSSILDRTLFHADNAYFLPDCRLRGRVCRTNLASNTAFRGFGGPQAVAAIENIVEEIAQSLGIDALEVRKRNLYGLGERDRTPYGQQVRNNTLPALVERLSRDADYAGRRAAIDAFNRTSKTQVKGMAMTLVKFGISFTTKFLNQGSALVNVYTDGTVQVSTGGTEMGQGLNTKIRQLVADALGVPLVSVLVMPTSTEKNANTPPTAASAGTDLNGAAAVKACRAIRARLAPLALRLLRPDDDAEAENTEERIAFAEGMVWDRDHPERRMDFHALALQAFRERIDLGERAYHATPGIDFDPKTGTGTPFFYYTNGAALAEVTLDRFTGERTTDRVDVLMDIGRSINPGIDFGQITGGFVQGMGWVTTEELRYTTDGALLSDRVEHYKIPTTQDMPAVFNVATLDGSENAGNVGSSKAVGEPPLLLGVCVWAAVKNALGYAAGGGNVAPLDLPATTEEILRRLDRPNSRP